MAQLLLAPLLMAAGALPLWAGDAGQAGSFLRQEVSARGAAMAGALTAATDDAGSLYWNPAGLSRLAKPELQATHIVLFEDTNYDYICAGLRTRVGGLGLAYLRQASGGFERRQTPFDAPTTFSIAQSAFLAGFGAALPLPWKPAWVTNTKPVELGAAIKAVRETIDTYSASGTGADFGVIFRTDDRFLLGLALQNAVAPEITFVRRPVSYPRALDIAPAYRWRFSQDAGALAVLRLSKISGRGWSPSGGVELDFKEFSFVRVGMQDKGMSTGIGLRLGNTSFDYATLLHEMGLSHTVTFTQRFGQTPEELAAAIRKGIRKLSRSEAKRLAKTYVLSAENKLRADDLPGAIKELEIAALWDPENPEIPKRIEEIRSRLESALSRRIIDASAALARKELDQGNLLSSRQYWRSVLELDTQNAEAKEALGGIDRRLSEDERRSAEALQAKGRELTAQRRRTAILELLTRGRMREALVKAEEAARMSPEDPEAVALREECRKRLQESLRSRLEEVRRLAGACRHVEALKIIESVLADDPGSAEAAQLKTASIAPLRKEISPETRQKLEKLYYQAVELYLKEKFDEAKSLVQQVLEVDPASESALKLQGKVDAALRIGKP
ncbi:MAG: hypothetical protein HY922_10235 [Elusimicrobia bacterium]|nr:hypothetical protein [Elusimicrobiota bacterium]